MSQINNPYYSLKSAIECAESLKSKYEYIAVISSHHPYSEGFWVETRREKMSEYDSIVYLLDRRILRNEKINKILS